jgi:3-isopropylmalate dehydrogenase
MTTIRITTLPGDGIGPEIVAQGVNVLQAVGEKFGHTVSIKDALIGGAAIDATGVPLPEATLALCLASDAVLLGAVGGPQWDSIEPERRPERGLLALRKGLGLYANIRPVKVHPATAAISPLKAEFINDVDLIVVRELTGGIYFGDKSLSGNDGQELATDLCSYTTAEIERIVRVAATLARGRRGKLTSVDKANVLETSRLWRRVASRVMRDEFPDVMFEHMLVDACAMHLIKRPRDFDVIVTENMFGDILTDEASVLPGSIGLLPSASLGDPRVGTSYRLGLYEPIHGSAPDIAGRGLANPIGTILSVAMMLRHSLGMDREAHSIEDAVYATLKAGYTTADIARCASHSTEEVGDHIVMHIGRMSYQQADGCG